MKTKEIQHTPGPWNLGARTGVESSMGSVNVDAGKRDQGGVYVASVWTGGVENGEGMANARLIVASPELLEAAKEVELCFGESDATDEWWSDQHDRVMGCDCGEASTPEHPHTEADLKANVMLGLRAAIAKAVEERK